MEKSEEKFKEVYGFLLIPEIKWIGEIGDIK